MGNSVFAKAIDARIKLPKTTEASKAVLKVLRNMIERPEVENLLEHLR
jgi:hypothetical protein